MKHPRRLTTIIVITVLLAVPTIWVGRRMHQQTLNRALIAAIKRSDAPAVDSLLAAGANPDTRDTPPKLESFVTTMRRLFHPPPPYLSPTALLVALHAPQDNLEYEFPRATLQIVTSLLRHNADVNAQDDDRNRPITALLMQGRGDLWVYPTSSPPLLETVIRAHANMEAPTPWNLSPLETACEFGQTDYIRILIAHGCNLNGNRAGGDAPLVLAVQSGQTDAVRILLDRGANVNPKTGPSGSPLSVARSNHNSQMIELLKAHGAKE